VHLVHIGSRFPPEMTAKRHRRLGTDLIMRFWGIIARKLMDIIWVRAAHEFGPTSQKRDMGHPHLLNSDLGHPPLSFLILLPIALKSTHAMQPSPKNEVTHALLFLILLPISDIASS
jgi:hypothetical protein